MLHPRHHRSIGPATVYPPASCLAMLHGHAIHNCRAHTPCVASSWHELGLCNMAVRPGFEPRACGSRVPRADRRHAAKGEPLCPLLALLAACLRLVQMARVALGVLICMPPMTLNLRLPLDALVASCKSKKRKWPVAGVSDSP